MPAPSPAGDDVLPGDFDASLEQPGVRRHAPVMRRPSPQGALAGSVLSQSGWFFSHG